MPFSRFTSRSRLRGTCFARLRCQLWGFSRSSALSPPCCFVIPNRGCHILHLNAYQHTVIGVMSSDKVSTQGSLKDADFEFFFLLIIGNQSLSEVFLTGGIILFSSLNTQNFHVRGFPLSPCVVVYKVDLNSWACWYSFFSFPSVLIRHEFHVSWGSYFRY